MTAIFGMCHCGNVHYKFYSKMSVGEMPLRTCQCTFCVRHNSLYTSDPGGRLEYAVKDDSQVERYTFGHETADFLICKRCGVLPLILSEIDGRVYGIINVCASDDFRDVDEQVVAKDFEEETDTERLDRRKVTWISDVVLRTYPLDKV